LFKIITSNPKSIIF